MPKGPLVKEAVEILIASVYDEHPEWTAAQVQQTVSGLLQKHDPNLSPGWPGLNSVQKVLTVLRKKNKEKEEYPLNKPWSLGVSAKHGIPADATPIILKVWESREEREAASQRDDSDSRPSIREAQWISRLQHVITDDIEALGRAAIVYARVEGYAEALGHPRFDSTGLDYGFIRSSRPMPFDLKAAVEHAWSRVTEARDIKHQEKPEKGKSSGQGGDSK